MLERGSAANQLWDPSDVALTAEGDYVIVDQEYHNFRIQLCPAASPGEDCETVVSGFVHGRDMYADGVAIDEDGNFIITDRIRVLRCNASECDIVAGGAYGSGDTQLSNPAGVLIDAAGDYVIADVNNHRIQLCSGSSPGSPCVTVVGTGTAGSGPTELRNPNDIALTPDGDYVVADTGNHRIQHCPAASPGTACETVAGGSQGGGLPQLDGPRGVAVAADGALLIADTGNHRLQRCVVGGLCVTLFGGEGSGAAQFNGLESVVIVNPSTTTVITTALPTTSTSAATLVASTPQATAAVASGVRMACPNFAVSSLMTITVLIELATT